MPSATVKGPPWPKLVDDGAAGGLHRQGGDHGGHFALGHQQAVKGADKSAEGQAEGQHEPDVVGVVEHLDAEAGDDGHLGAHGDIDLPGANDHGHAQGDDAGHRGLDENGIDVAPFEEVGVYHHRDEHDEHKGYDVAVLAEQLFAKGYLGLAPGLIVHMPLPSTFAPVE